MIICPNCGEAKVTTFALDNGKFGCWCVHCGAGIPCNAFPTGNTKEEAEELFAEYSEELFLDIFDKET